MKSAKAARLNRAVAPFCLVSLSIARLLDILTSLRSHRVIHQLMNFRYRQDLMKALPKLQDQCWQASNLIPIEA